MFLTEGTLSVIFLYDVEECTMPASRTRRRTPIKKQTTRSVRRRRPARRGQFDWKGGLIKFFIGLLIVVDVVLVFFIIRQCSRPAVEVVEETVQEPVRPLQIEILNGCGVSGIAAQFTDHLRAQGFDVVKTDNYESFNVQRTVVIDRRGAVENSVRIAEALGLGADRVLQEVNEAYLIDATVILGKDFRQLPCWQTMEK